MVTAEQHKRRRVSSLHHEGVSSTMIALRMKREGTPISSRTVRDWVRRIQRDEDAFFDGRFRKKTGNPKANRRGVRPLTFHDKRTILRFMKKKRGARGLSKKLPKGLKASPATLRRIGHASDWKAKHKGHEPMLSAANKEKRCVFAKSTVGFNWLHVVPCDEVTVTNAETANQHNDIEWLPENEKPKPRATVKFPISESRFAAVTSEGGVTLIPCTANPTAPECQKLLETALPLIEAKIGTDYCLLHDNLPGWKAASTQDYIEERVPAFFSAEQYPGQSPDFNLSENLFAPLKDGVAELAPKNRAELCAAIDTVWARVATKEKVAPLFASMPDRMRKCIRLKGRHTGY